MKKFRANIGFYPDIEELEVIKETEKQITYISTRGREIREAKTSQYHIWRDTKEELVEYMILEKQKEMENLNNRIVNLNSEIEKIKNL